MCKGNDSPRRIQRWTNRYSLADDDDDDDSVVANSPPPDADRKHSDPISDRRTDGLWRPVGSTDGAAGADGAVVTVVSADG